MRADVVICGAGPVGSLLALALADAGRRVALVDAHGQDAARAPFRPIALSHASSLILQRAGAWDGFAATPIESIHVSQSRSLGRTLFSAADARLPALGHVVEYGALAGALRARAAARVAEPCFDDALQSVAGSGAVVDVVLASGRHVEAACVVHAEGGSERMHEKRYAQDALVAEVEVDPHAATRAWERFTPEGPLALLPMQGRYAAVWAAQPERIAALEVAPQAAFLHALQDAFGRRAGRFARVHRRSRVPLALRRRACHVEGRQVYVGNAAQALHPVAGQGLNLGLRDAWDFARNASAQADAGDPDALARFGAARRRDANLTAGITDLLATSFVGTNPLAAAARGAAMLALDACAPARRFFARRMVFGPSAIP